MGSALRSFSEFWHFAQDFLFFFLSFRWRNIEFKSRIAILALAVSLLLPVFAPASAWVVVWPAMSSHLRAREIKTFAGTTQNLLSSTPSLQNVSIYFELERVNAWYGEWLYGDKLRFVGDVASLDDYNYLREIVARDCPTTVDYDVTICGKLPPH